MAVTITLEQLADHLRLDQAAVNAGDPRRTVVMELMQVASHHVERYAPDAPVDIQNLATARMAGYLYDAPPASKGFDYAPSFDNSGARVLLAPYRGLGTATVK